MQVSILEEVRQMLQRIKIYNLWNFHGGVYGQCQEQEEPNQMPAKDNIFRFMIENKN